MLESIDGPAALKRLDASQLPALAQEIRMRESLALRRGIYAPKTSM